MKKINFALASLLLSVSAFSTAQELSLKATEILPGLIMFEGQGGWVGGNLSVVDGEDGVVLIDGASAPNSQLVLDAVEQHIGKPVDYILNTHIHGDHTGNNKAIHEHGATIVAHDNIRVRMLTDGVQGPTGMRDVDPAELPQLTFSQTMTIYLNGYTLLLIHTPVAHTDGDAIIGFPGNHVVHAGDVFFNGLFPYIDLDSGGTVAGFLSAQKAMLDLAMDQTKFIPGHGPLGSKADLQAAYDMLNDSNNRVIALLEQGKTEDEIVALNPLADYHDDWNWNFITTERMTRTLVRGNPQP